MVYIGNIIKAYEEMQDDEEIILKCGYETETRIFKDDKLEKANGDLKIIRNHPKCAVVIDCNEVKFIIITKRWI